MKKTPPYENKKTYKEKEKDKEKDKDEEKEKEEEEIPHTPFSFEEEIKIEPKVEQLAKEPSFGEVAKMDTFNLSIPYKEI